MSEPLKPYWAPTNVIVSCLFERGEDGLVEVYLAADVEARLAEADSLIVRFQEIQDAIGDVLTGTPSTDDHTLVRLATNQAKRLAEVEQERDRLKETRSYWKTALSEQELSDPEYMRGYVEDYGVDFDIEIAQRIKDREEFKTQFTTAQARIAALEETLQRIEHMLGGPSWCEDFIRGKVFAAIAQALPAKEKKTL